MQFLTGLETQQRDRHGRQLRPGVAHRAAFPGCRDGPSAQDSDDGAGHQRDDLGAEREPRPTPGVCVVACGGQGDRRQQGRQGETVIKPALDRQRMADPLRNPLVVEQCVDQRDLGGRDDRGQTHRLPPRQHRQQQRSGHGPESQGQRDADEDEAKGDMSTLHDLPHVESGRLVEQDDGQRQLGQHGEAAGLRAGVDDVQARRSEHHAEQDEDQRGGDVPAADHGRHHRITQDQQRQDERGAGVHGELHAVVGAAGVGARNVGDREVGHRRGRRGGGQARDVGGRDVLEQVDRRAVVASAVHAAGGARAE